MSKEIDELLKNRPEIKSQVQQATKQLDTQTMPSQAIEGNPHPRPKDIVSQNQIHGNKEAPENAVSMHDAKSMPDAFDQKSLSPKSQSNEVDKALSERGKIESQETGKELNQQHQVSATKDQDLER